MKLLLIPFLFSSLTSPLFAQELELTGVPHETIQSIRKNDASLLDPPYTNQKLDQLLKKIHVLSGAKQVHLRKTKEQIRFEIHYHPEIHSLQWKGIDSGEQANLSNILRLKEGDNFLNTRLEEALIRLKSWFLSQSYLQAEITGEVKPTTDGKIDLILQVEKGPSCKIQSVSVDTVSSDLKEKLLSELSDFEDEDFSEDHLAEMKKKIHSYLVKNRYLLAKVPDPKVDVSEDRTQAKILFQVDNVTQFEFSFFGNSQISTTKILESIEWEQMSGVNYDIGAQVQSKILEVYHTNAYSAVEVKLTPLNQETKQVLRYDIVEGRQTKIIDWVLLGSYSRSSSTYIKKIKEYASPHIKKSNYVPGDIEEALKNLNIDLQNEGYLSSIVGLDRVEWEQSRKYVKIYVSLDEGPLTKIRSIGFQGLKAFSKEQLLEEIDLKEGTPLNLNQLEESVTKIKKFYLDNAYLDFILKNENEQLVNYSRNNTQADIQFQFMEGPQIEVKNILIQGTVDTKVSVVRRSLAFDVGDKLNLSKIQESETQLQLLGIFSSVDIRPAPGTTAQRSILVNVKEREPGVFTLGFGFTDENKGTVKSFTGLVYKNLGGSAKVFQSRIEVQKQLERDSFLQNKLTVSYLEPFLFNQRLKGRTSFSFSQDIDFLNSTDTETIVKETKEVDFFVEKDIGRHWKLGWKLWGITGTRRFEIDRKTEQDKLQVASIGPFVELDYRDHPFSPKSGTYTRFGLEYASPNLGSSEKILFQRTTGAFNQYIPINQRADVIFAYSLRGGFVKNLGNKGDLAIPQEKMFFLGGRSTIRGFDLSQIPAEEDIAGLKPAGKELYYVTDSSQFHLIKVELRFPLYGDLGAAIFYDGGLVDIAEVDIKDPYRHSAGFGLRYNTPVGPLSIEYGIKLDKKEGENQGRFHLSIGAF